MTLTKNELRVLNAIVSSRISTRKSIAVSISMSLVLVSSTLASLEKKGLVSRATVPGTGGGGRPTYSYSLIKELGCSIGIAIEPDHYHIVVLNARKELIYDDSHSLSLSTDYSEHLDNIVEQIEKELTSIVNEYVPKEAVYCTLGLTLPGMIDADQGIWLHGYQVTGISHVNMQQLLSDRLLLPIYIEDPARAITFYEQKTGSEPAADNFVLLYLGYGVGAGVVIDSKIFRGNNGLAGEIGHIIVDPNGPRCSCGDAGCLETVASMSAIVRLIQDRISEGVTSASIQSNNDRIEEITVDDILKLAKNNDRLARSTIYEIGEFIGNACAKIIKLFNPRQLVVSGPGTLFREYFEPRIHMMIEKHVITEMLDDFTLRFAEYEANQEAFGVALMSLENFWQKQCDDIASSKEKSVDLVFRRN